MEKKGLSLTLHFNLRTKFPDERAWCTFGHKMAPTLHRKLFDKTPQRTDDERLPPPTRSSKSSETLVTEGSDTDIYKKPSSAEEKGRNKLDIKTSCVQICPHETLTFERMKRIVHLPYFRYSGDKVDGFTNGFGPYHVSSVVGNHLCKPHPNRFSSLKANSFYKYQRGYEGSYDGLLLCVHWTMSFDDHMDVASSVSDFQRFLDILDIRLCQHTKMSDSRIAAKLYKLCDSSRMARDPVEAYEEGYRGCITERCKECHTTFETYKEGEACHILVKRYLGKGSSAYEKRWLAQCGEKRHRLWSFAAALRSWRT
ncbi:hypothetical protein HO173_004376 [Letharia columbiana]|uniref:Uncharacterized protein n=1 Tax=Letharia columbiana TaxID=112416 RepID=A0A8H6FZ84_9LECA|nr:uncharacterized protein HO173_004376 [Letharia columbiana]KAF6237486.1 hypothetical protein HO173_004376 [Letharia columbiana]